MELARTGRTLTFGGETLRRPHELDHGIRRFADYGAHFELIRDLAENYTSDVDFAPRNLFGVNDNRDEIVPWTEPSDVLVLGVVSTSSGMVLNSWLKSRQVKVLRVELAGCAPCKSVDDNGSGRRGDLVTKSKSLSHAMRAVPVAAPDSQDIFRPGMIMWEGARHAGVGPGRHQGIRVVPLGTSRPDGADKACEAAWPTRQQGRSTRCRSRLKPG